MRPENAPLGTRVVWHLRRAMQTLFRYTLPCRYVNYNRQNITEHGYLIMDYIETTDTEMLSETWTSHCQDQELRSNLFRDLSRIILSLTQLPLPRIGSWTIDDRGFLTLTNRPSIHQFHSLENEHIPTNIARTLTYTTTDTYYLDLLACHDSRIRNQPNSISDEKDGYTQMANLVTMRGLLPHFTSRSMRQGPFVFSLTDLHGSNIFVDSKWHIKYIIDLEWACSLPIEMLSPPYWITSRAVDELDGDELPKFEKACQDFTKIFEEEEKSLSSPYASATYRTDIMRKGLKTGNFWYFHALKSPKGLYNLFWQHLQPMFEPQGEGLKTDIDRFSEVVSPYWAPGTRDIVAAKLDDKKKYEEELRQLFEKGEPEPLQ